MLFHDATVELQFVIVNSERTNIFCDTLWSEIHLPNMYIPPWNLNLYFCSWCGWRTNPAKNSYLVISLARFLDSSVTTGGRWLVECLQPIVLLLCVCVFVLLCTVCVCVWVSQTTALVCCYCRSTTYYCSVFYVRVSINGYLTPIDKGYITLRLTEGPVIFGF